MIENDKDNILSELGEADLLKQLMPDPNNPDVNVLVGVFVGSGTDENTLRVYTTLELNQYFQVPRGKVLGAKRFPSGQIAVWVPGDLRVQVTTSNTVSGDFLKGSIQSASSRRATGISGLRSLFARRGPQQPFTRGPFCYTNSPNPDNPICGISDAGCPESGCAC